MQKRSTKRFLSALAALGLLLMSSLAMSAIPMDVPASYFEAGDINGNGVANGIDVSYGVSYFKGGNPPPHVVNCTSALGLYAEADANGTCQFNGIDITYMVSYLKGLGAPPQLCHSCLRDSVQVNDASILPGQNVTLHSDTTYILNGFVFVDSGATLTIQPGCIIKGHPGQAENASALLVARKGRIIADGTADAPIIFTASVDWTDDFNSVPMDLRGAWGGLIVLGCATTNNAGNWKHIEGIPETEPRGYYGGTDDADNSGIIRYVSIRHGGSIIGANNEINGLSMGAVGSGTIIDYVEVFSNLDDAFEWFGGSVNCKHLMSVFNDDDNIDYDEGYHGKIQFFCSLQSPELLHGNRGGEWDGGINPEDAQPYANPSLANVTFIGSGANSANTDNDWGIMLRDYGMGHVQNSIITDFTKRGLSIGDGTSGPGTLANLYDDSVSFHYTLWYNFGLAPTNSPYDIWRPDSTADFFLAHPERHNEIMTTPVLNSVSRTNDHNLDPRVVSSILNPPAPFSTDPWFTPANWYGCFEPNVPLWTDGWTYLSRLGFTAH
jgi:hypothetical protein